MSNTYDSQPAASSYDSARSLLPETLELWMSFLSRAVPPQGIRRLLDLGGGTGRFAVPIRDTYKCQVIVVDPSAAMLRSGAAFNEQGVFMIRGTAEHIPVTGNSIDLPGKFVVDTLFVRSNLGLASAAAIVMLVALVGALTPYFLIELRRKPA